MDLRNNSENEKLYIHTFVELDFWCLINVLRSDTFIEFCAYLSKEHLPKVETYYSSKVPHLE